MQLSMLIKKYNLIITMDADGTHDPKYFKQMIKKLIQMTM